MNRGWRAIQRVGEEIDISSEYFDKYLQIATEVHEEKLEQVCEQYDLDREYFEFLNKEVFNDERIIAVISNSNASKTVLKDFRESEFDISSAFRSFWRIEYGLDELVDLIMLLKLLIDYESMTGSSDISRTRMQYLAYLTNDALSKQTDSSIRTQKTDLGMLEHTGYRYMFRKRNEKVHSGRLSEDRNRLIASKLFDECVDSSIDSDSYEPFRLSLGSSGEHIAARYDKDMSNIDRAESDLLREWAICQKEILREWGNTSLDELNQHVVNINSFGQRRNGSVLLTGRARFFSLEKESIVGDLIKGVQRANA